MIRKIVEIITEKCIGCMLCINACHEQALILENGKAKLSSSIYCDGLGDCLPHCPTGAIKITEKEALDYDLEKTEEHRAQRQILEKQHSWPHQLKLISPRAPFLNNANILVAADCTAYAYTNFHKDFMIGKVPLIGCPKLDNYDYSKTLEEILIYNDIFTITLVKMEVPCCSGLEVAVKKALNNSGKNIPLIVKTITTKGEIN